MTHFDANWLNKFVTAGNDQDVDWDTEEPSDDVQVIKYDQADKYGGIDEAPEEIRDIMQRAHYDCWVVLGKPAHFEFDDSVAIVRHLYSDIVTCFQNVKACQANLDGHLGDYKFDFNKFEALIAKDPSKLNLLASPLAIDQDALRRGDRSALRKYEYVLQMGYDCEAVDPDKVKIIDDPYDWENLDLCRGRINDSYDTPKELQSMIPKRKRKRRSKSKTDIKKPTPYSIANEIAKLITSKGDDGESATVSLDFARINGVDPAKSFEFSEVVFVAVSDSEFFLLPGFIPAVVVSNDGDVYTLQMLGWYEDGVLIQEEYSLALLRKAPLKALNLALDELNK